MLENRGKPYASETKDHKKDEAGEKKVDGRRFHPRKQRPHEASHESQGIHWHYLW